MNEWNLSPQQAQKLLELAARRLSTDPETLRAALQRQDLQSLSSALPTELQSILGDKDKTAALLQDPTVRDVLSRLSD